MNKNIALVILLLTSLFLALKLNDVSSKKALMPLRNDLEEGEVRVVIKDYPSQSGAEDRDVFKARRYYEKAFNLFLIALGVRLSDDQKEELNELIEAPENYISKSDSEEEEVEELKLEQVAKELDFSPAKNFAQLIKEKELALEHIRDEALIKDLQGKVLKDPSLFYARSKYIKKLGALKKVIGEYRGQLYRISGENKGRTDEIYLKMDFHLKEEEIEGEFNLILSFDGRKYSNSSGNGANGNVRLRKGSIIIEAGPGSFFHFADQKMRQANFYTNGTLIGFARFTRL
jgi:hypothetical protein